MRYDRETLKAKIEWEGEKGITWFEPSEVPEDMEELWKDALQAYYRFEDLMSDIMDELDVE